MEIQKLKQTVIFPFGKNGLPLHPIANIEECMKSYKKETGYFFTPEQLNEYTQDVIKQSLETASDKQEQKTDNDWEFKEIQKSIINTFETTFNKFKIQ